MQIPGPNNKAMSFTVNVTGLRTNGSGEMAMFLRQGAIRNIAGTTSLVGSIQTIGTDIESDPATDVSITADDTNDALIITVTGIAAQNWRWTAHVQGVEIGIS